MKITLSEFSSFLETTSPPVAIATSGGPDSLCLLLLAHRWAQQKKGKVIALTVDHGLRPESTREALMVHKWAKERQIEHVTLTWSGEKPISRLQEKAREARYNLLINWCKENNVTTLLLGHHQQDQEETFWLRLSCGSGLEGLSGIKRKHSKDGITILRPLLDVSKERIKETLVSENQPWIEDPSNNNPLFFRGRLRSFLEKEGLSCKRLLQVMHKLQIDKDFMHDSVCKSMESILRVHEEGYISIDKAAFDNLHLALVTRILSHVMRWFSGKDYPPRQTQILNVVEKLAKNRPFTSGGILWDSQNKIILLKREISKVQGKLSLYSLTQDILWDQRFWINSDIRNVFPEDTYLEPLGIQPFLKKKVKSSLPYSVWQTLPALWVKGNIVSVPHLCYSEESDLDDRKFFSVKPLFCDPEKATI